MDKAEKMLAYYSCAPDLVQEVFAALWRRRHKMHIDHLEHYLFQAIRFQVCRFLRNQLSEREYYGYQNEIDSGFITDDQIIVKELRAGLDQVISGLPYDQQQIFHLHRQESFTYKEIAGRLGISVKTVEKKISLSLRSLREWTKAEFMNFPHFRKNLQKYLLIKQVRQWHD